MPGTTPGGWPYAQPADARIDWPALSQQLATKLESDVTAGDKWTPWTPTITGSTVSSADCRYRRTPGGLVTIDAHLTIASVASNTSFALPVTASKQAIGVCGFYDLSAGRLYLGGTYINGANCSVYAQGTANILDPINATKPFTWAAGDVIHVFGEYAL